MEGYIKSTTGGWRHIFKRSVRPGGKIPLSELYAEYGKKNSLPDNEKFVTWLKDVKLNGTLDTWEVITMDEKPPEDLVVDAKTKEPSVGETLAKASDDSLIARAKTLSVMELVELSVRPAREIIPKITDLKLLKYAYQEANQRSNKESLCRIMEKRIRELEQSR